MKYISTMVWRDLTDGHLYAEGDPFPFDGREIAPGKLAELESGRNKAGLRLIRAIDAGDEQDHGQKPQAPERAENGPQKAKPAAKPKTAKPKQSKPAAKPKK